MPKDLKKTYNQYLTNLDGKTAILTTPFTPLDCFYIKFDILQLPHLLGLHKIYMNLLNLFAVNWLLLQLHMKKFSDIKCLALSKIELLCLISF